MTTDVGKQTEMCLKQGFKEREGEREHVHSCAWETEILIPSFSIPMTISGAGAGLLSALHRLGEPAVLRTTLVLFLKPFTLPKRCTGASGELRIGPKKQEIIRST